MVLSYPVQGIKFRILCQWNFDSELQSLAGFRILNSECSQIFPDYKS